MSITGGIKFFSRNLILESEGATITATSGNGIADYCLDKNPITFWTSVGSDDTTTETLEVTLPSTTISRILLQNHNFKDFNIQYWNGAAYAHFASVVGLDGSKANITETAFADDTAYYEFTPVTTTKLRIQVLKSQIADAQKFLCQFIACTELGTITGWPTIKMPSHSRNERTKVMLSGKVNVQKGIDSFKVRLDFDRYPTAYGADIGLMMDLFDSENPFLVWLCGGRRGTTYFRMSPTPRGMRLRDIYLMQTVGEFRPEFVKGIYTNPVGLEVQLVEHV